MDSLDLIGNEVCVAWVIEQDARNVISKNRLEGIIQLLPLVEVRRNARLFEKLVCLLIGVCRKIAAAVARLRAVPSRVRVWIEPCIQRAQSDTAAVSKSLV